MERDRNPSRSMLYQLSALLAAPTVRWTLLACSAAILAIVWPWTHAVQFDRRIESLLPASDPVVQAFSRMREQLGGSDSVVVVWQEPELLASDGHGVKRLATIVQQLNDLDEVAGTLSLVELDQALKMMGAGQTFPILMPEQPISVIFRELFAGYTHSLDGQWAGIVVLFHREADHATTIDKIRDRVQHEMSDQEVAYIVGEPAIIVEGFSLLESDGERLSHTILFLLSVVLLVILRRTSWIIAIVLVVLWSRWLTRAILATSGIRLTMISGMLDAVLTVIAVATVIHLALRYTSEASRTGPRVAAEKTWRGLLPPIVWSLLTTAVGFGSLAFSTIIPVRQFGWMMALGTAVVFVGVLLICPAFLGPPWASITHSTTSENRRLQRGLLQTLGWVKSHALTTISTAVFATLLSFVGLSRLQVETNFLHNFRNDSQIVRSYEVVEKHFGGAGVWDIILPAPERLNNAYIRLVFELEQELRSIEADSGMKLTKVLSLADADLAAKSQSRLLAIAGPTVRLKGMQLAIPSFYEALVSSQSPPGQSLFRILLRSNEQATASEKLQLISQVEACVARHLGSDEWKKVVDGVPEPSPATTGAGGAELSSPSPLPQASSTEPGIANVTGYYVLLTRLVAGLLSDQWSSFFIASVGIVLCVRMATGHWDLALAATVPSVLPILLVLGSLGYLGVRINLGAAMIAAVSVGLSIDGSIHYLHTYQIARNNGHRPRQALQRAQRSTGLAVSVATIALAIGLLTLVTSPLKPTAAFGLLSGVTLLAGLAGNLILLPALIGWPSNSGAAVSSLLPQNQIES
jgi:uncharacterized protein